mmetsp:Transcript_41086/g.124064  ORF Transcript_41086/g.124064 Transcript_41086/m.124064 type:complete len:238 (-) Transcript_41086:25-738(-)
MLLGDAEGEIADHREGRQQHEQEGKGRVDDVLELARGAVLQRRVHWQDAHLDDDALEQGRAHRNRAFCKSKDAKGLGVDTRPELVFRNGAHSEPIHKFVADDPKDQHRDEKNQRRRKRQLARVQEAQRHNDNKADGRHQDPQLHVFRIVIRFQRRWILLEKHEAAVGDDDEVPDETQEHGDPHTDIGCQLQSRRGPATQRTDVADQRSNVEQIAAMAGLYDHAQGPTIHKQDHRHDD